MIQSPEHTSAVFEAVRVPAMSARLALLAKGAAATPASIALYADPSPAVPGGEAAAPPIVSIALSPAAGVVTDEVEEVEEAEVRVVRLVIDAPIEGQVTGADPAIGSIPTWGRILGPTGDWWADVTVTVEGEGGDIQMAETGQEGDPAVPVVRLFQGAFARITSFVLVG